MEAVEEDDESGDEFGTDSKRQNWLPTPRTRVFVNGKRQLVVYRDDSELFDDFHVHDT